jgi:hypothetical protein
MAKSTKNTDDPMADEVIGDTGMFGEPENTPTPPPAVAPTEPVNDPRVPLIYCGPSVPRAKIVSMSLYRGGLPKNISALIEKYPEIGKLIVPVTELAATQKKISTQGTEENRLFQSVLAQRGEIENGV